MNKQSNKPIIYWLLTGCFLIFAMVIIGGITRLTESGLSIVEWNVVGGTIPPMNQEDWVILFQKYQSSPQFNLVNNDFSIEDFKSIFWWEYIHRLLGRFIGLVFFIPFVYFLVKEQIDKSLLKKLLIVFFLGGFQGFLGWYMVKSGLVKNPAVSHFRLAAHLITAFASFAFTFWVALELIFDKKLPYSGKDSLRLNHVVYLLFGFTVLQIIYGALVAGLDAGMIYNSFPKMGEEWIAESVYYAFSKEGIASLWNNPPSVQFIHRSLAYLVVMLVLLVWYKANGLSVTNNVRFGINLLVVLVLLQFVLGVVTLLYKVPVSLGVIHQAAAFILFANLIYIIFHLIKKVETPETSILQ